MELKVKVQALVGNKVGADAGLGHLVSECLAYKFDAV